MTEADIPGADRRSCVEMIAAIRAATEPHHTNDRVLSLIIVLASELRVNVPVDRIDDSIDHAANLLRKLTVPPSEQERRIFAIDAYLRHKIDTAFDTYKGVIPDDILATLRSHAKSGNFVNDIAQMATTEAEADELLEDGLGPIRAALDAHKNRERKP